MRILRTLFIVACLLVLVLPSSTLAQQLTCTYNGALQDAVCTPGAIDPAVTQDTIGLTICIPGYSKSVRPSSSITAPIKLERMQAYGVGGQPTALFELDHLISLELGGAPAAVANLWPEPLAGDTGALVKDQLENDLHRRVCAGEMLLADAQLAIAGDWLATAQSLGLTAATVDQAVPGEDAEIAGGATPVAPPATGPSGYDCPSDRPIKGNASSHIYHVPGGASYATTKPEACFATEAEAQAAGYRRAQR